MAAETKHNPDVIVITFINVNKNKTKTLTFDAKTNPTFEDVVKAKSMGKKMLILQGESKPFIDLNAPLTTLSGKTFLKHYWTKTRGAHPYKTFIDAQGAIWNRQRAIEELEKKNANPDSDSDSDSGGAMGTVMGLMEKMVSSGIPPEHAAKILTRILTSN